MRGHFRTATAGAAIVLLLLALARAAQLWTVHIGCEQTWDDGAVQLARDVHYYSLGGPMYSDLRKPPYYALEYGPVVPFLMLPLTRRGGAATGVFACLRAGRWLTIGATFAACLTMILLASRSSSLPAAVIAITGFALTSVFFPWFAEFRVDMPALFLELSGLYAITMSADPIALMLFVAAFMTKQTYVAGVVAAVGWCWWRGQRRRALMLAAGWVAIAAIALALVQWRNPFYLLNTVESHVPLWDWTAPAGLLGCIALVMLPLLLMAAAGVGRSAWRMSLEIAYAAAAFALCGVSALRWGSDYNYFLQLAAAIAILAASGFDVLLGASSRFSWAGQVAAGAALAVVLTLPAVAGKKLALRSLLSFKFGLPAESCDTSWTADAFRILARTSGPILTALPEINLRLDRRVWAPEFDVLSSMGARGLFDDGGLVGSISNKRISAIVLGPEGLDAEYRGRKFFWPRLREAIERNYAPADRNAIPYLMLPKR